MQEPCAEPCAGALWACKCHLKMEAGLHQDHCLFHPLHLKQSLAENKISRESMWNQLKKTTLVPKQREFVLEAFYGTSLASSAASSSGGSGNREEIRSWFGEISAL